MADCILLQAGGGGLDPDELTATAGDVLKEMLAGVKGYDDPVYGTLELTGTAADSQVLSGQSYYNTNAKEKRTGTMPNRGAPATALNCGGVYNFSAGYYSGGKVTANSLTSQTPANASAGQILTGYNAWVNGGKVNGGMTNRGGYGGFGNSHGNDVGNQRMWVRIPGGYYNENANVYLSWADIRSMAGLTADKIKKGQSIMGIMGSFEGYATSPLYLYNNGTWSGLQTPGWQGSGEDIYGGRYFFERSGVAVNSPFCNLVCCCFKQTFDLSNYKYIKITSNNNNHPEYVDKPGYPFVAISKQYNVVDKTSTERLEELPSEFYAGTTGDVGTTIFDISNISGAYYIYIGMKYRVGTKAQSYTLTITQLYLTNA